MYKVPIMVSAHSKNPLKMDERILQHNNDGRAHWLATRFSFVS